MAERFDELEDEKFKFCLKSIYRKIQPKKINMGWNYSTVSEQIKFAKLT